MHRYIFLILTLLLATSGVKADIYVTPAQGARLLAGPQAAAEPRQLTSIEAADTLDIIPSRYYHTFLQGYIMPVMFDTYHFSRPITVAPDSLDNTPAVDLGPASDWLTDRLQSIRRLAYLRQQLVINEPLIVRYNLTNMTAPPADLRVSVKGSHSHIVMKDIPVEANKAKEDLSLDKENKHWLHTFNASMQFSQAYVSPNWYQGGNNNVNGIGSFKWNVKLNQKFHPEFIVEATTEYKVGIASAPQDTIHAYNITQDQFQFNGTLGLKAFDKWYYSLNAQFKTQLLNNYKPNTRELKAAFMTPGELNLGVGMTYNYKNPERRLTLDASISPFSYNLKIATNPGIPKSNFGIDPGHHTISEFGSNAEVKLTWTLAWNVTYSSRLFLFTDYDYTQGDWENTFNFSINRYFSTQLFIHVRYDSHQLPLEDTNWHHWQLKEILSFGFQYQFKTI